MYVLCHCSPTIQLLKWTAAELNTCKDYICMNISAHRLVSPHFRSWTSALPLQRIDFIMLLYHKYGWLYSTDGVRAAGSVYGGGPPPYPKALIQPPGRRLCGVYYSNTGDDAHNYLAHAAHSCFASGLMLRPHSLQRSPPTTYPFSPTYCFCARDGSFIRSHGLYVILISQTLQAH